VAILVLSEGSWGGKKKCNKELYCQNKELYCQNINWNKELHCHNINWNKNCIVRTLILQQKCDLTFGLQYQYPLLKTKTNKLQQSNTGIGSIINQQGLAYLL
jgi:hypothetical protein